MLEVNEIVSGLLSGVSQTMVGHPFDTIKVWHQSGFKDRVTLPRLYYGVLPPTLGSGLFNSVVFGGSHLIHNQTNSWLIAGLGAGLVGGLTLNPLDVWKIQRQVNRFSLATFQPMRGVGMTTLRESLAMGCYMSTYHYLHDQLEVAPMFAGAATGMLTWITTYPLDVLKTRLQTDYQITLTKALEQGRLWVGLPIVLVRAALVNGVSFTVYEWLKRLF